MQKVSPGKRQELIALVKRIAICDYRDDVEFNELTSRLRNEIVDPYVVDYIFRPKYDLTPEQIVDKALAYEPIILPDRSGEV